MTTDNPADELIRASACVEIDDRCAEAIRQACRRQRDWSRTIREAELHGMAPWLHKRIGDADAGIPEDIGRKLSALAFRHADAIRIRTRALLEITEQLRLQGIDMLVLKARRSPISSTNGRGYGP